MYGHISQGAYAQYIATNIRAISKIPDDMNYDIASIMDTLSIALHMIERTNFRVGDDVLVNGAGAQGWMSIICLKTMGANKIYCSGSGRRLEMAAELGAIPINYRYWQSWPWGGRKSLPIYERCKERSVTYPSWRRSG